ncbi:hypothetical protein RN001_008729 [Aquatica leii]|uniref:Carboxylesterase type B domain-containing protein n=1 Tax=Aquatica leii TaxID=1421715 RepID=A0AAN7PB30_9COLE|nr:hypothetical protein RN001_008729 [Aquatica leii]
MHASILCLLVVAVGFANAANVELTFSQGTLKGKEAVSRNGRSFRSFTGIPYAKPPINRLRFQPPEAAIPWKGIFDATKTHERCLQVYSYLKNYTVLGNEDCLYLNVYLPNVSHEEKLPVMVFIHGGAFITGSASDYNPNLLMDHDVVLVTINYRLGPFGFLTTSTFHMLGNDGLKDQALAIKWVKENIAAFGGDSEKITVFGQGAGGISAHLHMLSPLSKHLISGVIAQSGTAVGHNAIMPYFLSVRNTKFLAERLKCPVHGDMDDMMRCLIYKNGKQILEKLVEFREWDVEPITLFKPVMEPDVPGAFLIEDPARIILKGDAAKVPFITGITSNEGDLRTSDIKDFNKNIDTYLPNLLGYRNVVIHKNLKPATESIKMFYLNNKNLSNANKNQFSKMYMDSLYLHGADFAVDLHLTKSKQSVYYYIFGYKGSQSYCKLYDSSTECDYGVCHSDDLLYIFNDNKHFPNFERNEDDNKVIDLMTKLWVTFATHGNPTPEDTFGTIPKWQPSEVDHVNYYFIKDGQTVENNTSLFKKRSKFWKKLELNDKRKQLKDEL